MSHRPAKQSGLALVVHSIRVLVVIALLLLIPSPIRQSGIDTSEPPSIDEIRTVLPTASSLDDFQDQSKRWCVQNEVDQPIGSVVRTLPIARDVVGYRGPTESAIVFDLDMKIVGVRMLNSADTEEHVDAVRASKEFFNQFKGWPWGGPDQATEIDGVSGATLTSLALAEGVLKCIGGNRPSLLFPAALSIEEVVPWYPNADTIDESKTVAVVKDSAGRVIGRLMRTGPLADDVTGYRGPTELMMKLDENDRIQAIKIRSSYDNMPFTGWVRDESKFWRSFEDQTVSELGRFDLDAAGVEGVSGATMTSLAIADTIVQSAGQAVANIEVETAHANRPTTLFGLRWSVADLATLSLLLLTAIASRLHWFRRRRIRKLWLVTVVMVIGFWAGNLVSMALVAGWAAEGIAWQLAPGLAAIATVALVAPPTTSSNSYCNHLCPHGAVQQLIKPSRNSRRQIHVPPRISWWLTKLPGTTLVVAYVALIIVPSIDLSSWEPFHAYLFRIAGWGSIALASLSLAVAAMIPMGYCRFGCPTGSLLDYLRRSAVSERVQAGDLIAIGLMIFAFAFRS